MRLIGVSATLETERESGVISESRVIASPPLLVYSVYANFDEAWAVCTGTGVGVDALM